jgi:hypothetical protein
MESVPCCDGSPFSNLSQVTIFKDLNPELTEEHQVLKALGVEYQRDLLKTLFIRYGGLMTSAVKSEMLLTKCTYEDACVRFMQAADVLTGDMYYVEMGDSWQKEQTVSE